MAIIPINVDVDDSAFRNFLDAFKKYQSGLEESGEQWGVVVTATGQAAESATVWRGAIEAGSDALAHATSLGSKFQQSAEKAAGAFAKVQSATKGAASHIKEATAALLKWSALTLVGGGVGAWSMDALGSHVSGVRTGAMRAGTTAGGLEAFKINFGRFGNAEGVLNRVAEIQNSADHTALRNLGITDAEINSMDPADLAALAYRKLQERAKGQNPNFLGDWLSSNRINEVFDLGQALQARSTSAEEMQDVQQHYRRDRPRLEMTPEAQLGWTKFTMTLDLASGVIKKAFAENLSHITGGLGKLSDAFSEVLRVLLDKGGPVEDALKWLNNKLIEFADDIGNGAVKRKLNSFFDGVHDLAETIKKLFDGLVSVAEFFGLYKRPPRTGGASPYAWSGENTPRDWFGGGDAGKATPGGTTPQAFTGGQNSELKAIMDKAAREAGIDPRVMYGIHAGESLHSNRYDVKDDALESSWGPFQLNRRRGLGVQFERETGLDVRDPRTIPQQAQWVAQFLKRGGDLRNWAGYHGNRDWNPRWGNAGLDRAPQQVPPTYRTKVVISKPPGGDIAASANAAAR
jgi:hypothetical protein